MIRLAIIGFGKIARDAHLPALRAHSGYDLKAVVTTSGCDQAELRCFPDADAMLAAMAGQIDAVAISTPPGPRYAIARKCLAAGLDCLLEKPPTPTIGEIEALRDEANERGRVIFTTWHSQYAAAVEQARALLADKRIASMRITWREDVNKYHPGQDWVWEAEGFGVFDPGINALSISSRILPARLIMEEAVLRIPEGRQQPIAARMTLSSPAADGPIDALFDWSPVEAEEWTIAVQPIDGPALELTQGGGVLSVGGEPVAATGDGEYPGIYAAFAEMVAARRSHVDIEPLRLVADALMIGRREAAPAFAWRAS